jgi:deazaflavin-dependent oxidoreductase (nitroreductase family)
MSVKPVDPNQDKGVAMRSAEWLAQQRPVTWFLVNLGPKIDPRLMKLTGGRVRLAGAGPTVLVTHTGAKSGKQRTTPLAYFTDGEGVVLVASKGGAPSHPAWYHNLKANPDVEASTDGRPGPYRAREAEGSERERLWDLATTMYSGYADYQRRAPDRRIPVMILEPRRN